MRRMKTLTMLIIVCAVVSFVSTTVHAQQDDKELVRQAVLDYVEALYEADSSRIERSVHPDLFKLGFERTKEGTYKPYRMTYQELFDLAGRWNKSGKLPKNSKKEIVVFDVSDQTAAAKLTAFWGIDYLHLAKFDGKWKITDILWQTPPPVARPN